MVRIPNHLAQLLDQIHDDRNDQTDRMLLEQHLAGDSSAFPRLMKRHGAMVFGSAKRITGDEHLAEDLFQATFLILAKKAARMNWNDSIAGWLHQVVRRLALRQLPISYNSAIPDDSTNVDILTQLSAREWLQSLEEEIAQLPKNYREVLLLCGVESLSRQQAAQRLGWSVGTIKGYLERGRQRLRQRLERRGFGDLLGIGGLLASTRTVISRDLLQRTQDLIVDPQAIPLKLAQIVEMGIGSSWFKPMVAVIMLFMASAIGVGSIFLVAQDSPKEKSKALPIWKNPVVEYSLKEDYPLPEQAIFRIGSRKYRAEGWIGSAIPTPDGKQILTLAETDLSGSPPLGLTLMDLQTGLPIRTYEESRRVCKREEWGIPPPFAYSPDGKILYGLVKDTLNERDPDDFWAYIDNSMKRQLRIWDAATGKILSTHDLPGNTNHTDLASLLGVKVSPDGKRLYVSGSIIMRFDENGTLRGMIGNLVYDAKTMELLHRWDHSGWYFATLADGKTVVTYDENRVYFREADTGKMIRQIQTEAYTGRVALSPDEKHLAALRGIDFDRPKGDDQPKLPTVQIFETKTGKQLASLDVSFGGAYGEITFDQSGKQLFISDSSGNVQQWNWKEKKQIRSWKAHANRLSRLFVSLNGKELITTGHDGVIRRWDHDTGKPLVESEPFQGRTGFTLSHNHRWFAIADSTGRLEIWDLIEKKLVQRMNSRGTAPHGLAFSPDDRQLAVVANSGKSGICNWQTKEWIHDLPAAPKELIQPEGESGWGGIQFTPDGKHLVACKFWLGTWMWEIASWKKIWHIKEIEGTRFLPDQKRMLCGGWDQKLKLRSLQTGELQKEFPIKGMSASAMLHDRQFIAIGDIERSLRVFDFETEKVILERKFPERIYSMTRSPSGRLLAIGTEKSIHLLEVISWQEVARFDGHLGGIWFLSFLDESKLLSGCTEDGTAMIWTVQPKHLTAQSIEAAGEKLQSDSPEVENAIWSMIQRPNEAIGWFKKKFPIPEPIPAKQLEKHLADLDSPRFKVRQDATAALIRLNGQVRDALETARKQSNSAETRDRLDKILEAIRPTRGVKLSADEMLEWRAVWILEQIGTTEAIELLDSWAKQPMGRQLSQLAGRAKKQMKR